ncbi:hypothetical protein LRS74_15690 [Streptomyces sp. LX-29]|uniref:hypothetical protein n=1 Tax=Streptomyces sp. LX-29 TaxID=2900152 RepID=UPI00240E2CCD|nr:hypothetical protein [Streptomyces sp. LX-29]WFB08334.1 hypothetical protein LRS74_15690 [Streptomyces sp. LX-29]
MSKWVRGAVAGVALMAVLTGCGDEDKGGGSSGQGVTGGAFGGGKKSASGISSTQQVGEALPSERSLGGGWKLMNQPRLRDSAETASACQQYTGTACTGVLAGGESKFISDSQDSTTIFADFSIYAVDSPENAKVLYQAIQTSSRQKASEDFEELSFDLGADESYSYSDFDGPHAIVRVGGVLALVELRSEDLEEGSKLETAEHLAIEEVERIRKVAAGENPDA